MTATTQDLFVLLFVAAAAIYMVFRLRRVAAGQNKCACGNKACAGASAPCGGVENSKPAGGLPLLSPGCDQGGCGCGKG